ncbi:MAG: 16S rRNA (guanine(966)-N(2))-methyltransferase RsmD [Halioglobus sp.]|nr:16S rRNA (guanine(966)-N(2))-methyltransferase RsmD [Halioglobus sp.]
MSGTGSRAGKQRQVRIIGGRWRGRKLAFSPAEGLRPTGDRIRETLFNWLAPHIQGARCADLFAGSGALGLEALSRGASHCDFIDSAGDALSQIKQHLATLRAQDQGSCHATTAQQFLRQAGKPYDIVFIDPPFNRQLVEPVCAALALGDLLTSAALIYVETAATEPSPLVLAHWLLHREKVSGGVAYRLFQNASPGDSA